MATELGVGYVSILPSMRGFGPALNAGMQAPAMAAGDKAGSGFGSSLLAATTKVIKGASIGATIFGGIALKSGLDRLTTIQNATQSLTTIMGDAGKAAMLMGEIKKTVQGTPFNLDQFADAGKNLVAMNVAAEKVPSILTAIGDAAATSGKGAQGLGQLVDTFGKMAAQGQVSLDQVWSISAAGVPALQILANGFNTTTDDMKNMISEGSVPATKAIDILTAGIENGSNGAAGATIAFAGSMAGLRQTFTGAFGGMKAAVARFGAAVLGPFVPLMTNAFTSTGAFLDRVAAKVTPVMTKAAAAVSDFMAGITLTDASAIGAPLEGWVKKGQAVRDVLIRIKDGAVGLYQFIVNGDFTGAFSRAFGVDEDSPVVDYMFKIRDAVGQVVQSFRSVDMSSVSAAVSSTGTAFSQIGTVFTTVKDNAAVLQPALSDLGTVMTASAGGGAVILSNLLHIAADAAQFFADHTGIATAAILAVTAAMAASGPISEAYRLAYVARTPLMVVQTIQTWSQAGAMGSLTAALNANTIAMGGNAATAQRGIIVTTAAWVATQARTAATWVGVTAINAWAAAEAIAARGGIVGTAVRWGMTAAQGAWNVITAIGSGIATGFGVALRFMLGPVGLIITGIALLVAGLVWFFTKTEVGHKIITAVWAGIKAVIGAVVDWFVNTAWPFIQKVWDGIAAGATWLWRNVLQPVFSFIWQAFQVVGDVVMKVWTGYLSPIFQLIGAIVSWLWSNVLSLVFKAIQLEWQAVATVFSWAWDNILHPVFDAIATVASWLWDNVLSPVFGWIGDRWNDLMLGMQILWATVLQPALGAIGDAFNWIWNNIISPVIGAIQTAWSGLMSGMKWVWDNLLSPIFGSGGVISIAINAVQTAFENVVSGVKTAWDKLIDIAKAPVRFVVNTVINDVFIEGFNKLAGIFGTDKMDKIKLPDGFARGGYTGDGGKYQPMGVVHGGEFVFTKEQTARFGRNQLEMLANRGVPGYANGGFVEPMFNTVKAHFSDALLNSGYRPGANDYHGKGQAIDIGQASRPNGGDGSSFLASVSQWITDTYGSKSAEIIYDGLYDNRPDIKNGSPSNYGPATSAQHHNHVHWALNSLDALSGAATAGGGGGGVVSSVLDFLGGLSPVKWLTDKVNGVIGQVGDSGFAKMAAGFPKHLLSMIVDKFTSIFSSGATQTANGTGLDSWIATAMGITHVPASWSAGLHTLIQRESGGNPMAINNSDINAQNGDPSRGLMQTIGATFQRYRDKSLIDDIYDPVANIVAGINYIKARYGDIANVQQANPNMPPKGYDNGGWLQPGRTLVDNRTGKPEPVFNPQQWATMAAVAAQPASSTTVLAPEVHVFVGNQEITDIVRVEMKSKAQQTRVDAIVKGASR